MASMGNKSDVGSPPFDEILSPHVACERQKFTSQATAWHELQQRVKDAKRCQMSLANRVPAAFTMRSHPTTTADGTVARLYFLGVLPAVGRRENTLLYTDVTIPAFRGNFGMSLSTSLTWHPLLDVDGSGNVSGELSKEEQLLRERRRITSLGVTAYDMHQNSGTFAFVGTGGSLVSCSDFHFTDSPLAAYTDTCDGNVRTAGVKLDPKICPSQPQLLGYVCDGDVWVQNEATHTSTRLTFTRRSQGEESQDRSAVSDPKSAGAPPFIIQEEFDRCTGYWWQPLTGQLHRSCNQYPMSERQMPEASPSQSTSSGSLTGTYSILYEEVDESLVDIVHLPSAPPATSFAASEGGSLDGFRYPRAGSNNAKSSVKVVQFTVDNNGNVVDIVNRCLCTPLQTLFPWYEYIVRMGWHPSGTSVWVELMDRLQQHLALVLLPLEAFVSCLSDDEALPKLQISPNVHILHEEWSDIWINVHDCLYFLADSEPGQVAFIWSSEATGYRHLYLCSSSVQGDEAAVHSSEALTSGDWEVCNQQQLWVDELHKVVYFIGSMDTALESHLYCVSYVTGSCGQGPPPQRLTELGYSHCISMSLSVGLVVDTFSSITMTTSCCVLQLQWQDVGVNLVPLAMLLSAAETESSSSPLTSRHMPKPPQLESFMSSTSGRLTNCLIYEPADLEPGRRYPTILFVYGGPQVQLVTNANKLLRFMRLYTLASVGYAVVVIDGRGSKGRGLLFESHLKNRMGTVEVADQVEGLHVLAERHGFIDLDRVAVHGWSYGGYLALMALAQRPDVFKVCVAGAPVTNWHLYDTGYTERYMGLPASNADGYSAGSVLSHVDRFPDTAGRLLIIHGLIDENVHFTHTSSLLNSLVKACKPYQLQVYPGERHGIRSPEANEHFETTVLHFLQQNL